MLKAGSNLVSIAPDACEDNIMEEYYTLYANILVAILSALVRASQVVGI